MAAEAGRVDFALTTNEAFLTGVRYDPATSTLVLGPTLGARALLVYLGAAGLAIATIGVVVTLSISWVGVVGVAVVA